MRARQQGITAIGLIIMVLVVGSIAFGALRLIPIYLEHMKIVSVLNDVKEELDGQNPSISNIRVAISKRLNVEMVYALTAKDFQITKTEGGFNVAVQYSNRAPYLGNLYLVAEFDNSVEIRR